MNLDYVKNQRGLSFVEKGMKVENTYSKRTGVIKGGNSSGNLDILFDGDKKNFKLSPYMGNEVF